MQEDIMKKKIAFLLIVLIARMVPAMAGQSTATAASPASRSTLNVRPSALGPLVEDQSIKMMLKDGTYVEGKVLLATEYELQMKVKRSEPSDRIKRGESRIPTGDISVVHIKKNGSIALPILLGVAGGFGGLLTGAYVGYMADEDHNLAVGLGIGLTAAGATGGAYLGNEVVKRTVTINVVAPKYPTVD
jgi:hypothetical protein